MTSLLPQVAVVGSATRFPVRRIYCVGRNYVDHVREMKEADERDPPFFFQKPADSVVPEGAEIPYPQLTNDLQYEVELVVAIAAGGRNVAMADTERYIFGYAIGIDLTRRDRQREARDKGLPWEMGKSLDHSAPCGPLHPIGSTGLMTRGTITLGVNGKVKQTGDIGNMIWNVAEIISNLSHDYALERGDLIFTGTPAGVGQVVPGDHIECAIDGLGTFRVTIGPKKA